jgi:hypothetical protein
MSADKSKGKEHRSTDTLARASKILSGIDKEAWASLKLDPDNPNYADARVNAFNVINQHSTTDSVRTQSISRQRNEFRKLQLNTDRIKELQTELEHHRSTQQTAYSNERTAFDLKESQDRQITTNMANMVIFMEEGRHDELHEIIRNAQGETATLAALDEAHRDSQLTAKNADERITSASKELDLLKRPQLPDPRKTHTATPATPSEANFSATASTIKKRRSAMPATPHPSNFNHSLIEEELLPAPSAEGPLRRLTQQQEADEENERFMADNERKNLTYFTTWDEDDISNCIAEDDDTRTYRIVTYSILMQVMANYLELCNHVPMYDCFTLNRLINTHFTNVSFAQRALAARILDDIIWELDEKLSSYMARWEAAFVSLKATNGHLSSEKQVRGMIGGLLGHREFCSDLNIDDLNAIPTLTELKMHLKGHDKAIADKRRLISMQKKPNMHASLAHIDHASSHGNAPAPHHGSKRNPPAAPRSRASKPADNSTPDTKPKVPPIQLCRSFDKHQACPYGDDCKFRLADGSKHGNNTSVPKDHSCGACRKIGDHWWLDCPDRTPRRPRRREEASMAETGDYEDEVANMAFFDDIDEHTFNHNSFLDSGTSKTMFGNHTFFPDLRLLDVPVSITSAFSDTPIIATHGGRAIANVKTLDGTWSRLSFPGSVYCPDLPYNLISVGRLTEQDLSVSFTRDFADVSSASGFCFSSHVWKGVFPLTLLPLRDAPLERPDEPPEPRVFWGDAYSRQIGLNNDSRAFDGEPTPRELWHGVVNDHGVTPGNNPPKGHISAWPASAFDCPSRMDRLNGNIHAEPQTHIDRHTSSDATFTHDISARMSICRDNFIFEDTLARQTHSEINRYEHDQIPSMDEALTSTSTVASLEHSLSTIMEDSGYIERLRGSALGDSDSLQNELDKHLLRLTKELECQRDFVRLLLITRLSSDRDRHIKNQESVINGTAKNYTAIEAIQERIRALRSQTELPFFTKETSSQNRDMTSLIDSLLHQLRNPSNLSLRDNMKHAINTASFRRTSHDNLSSRHIDFTSSAVESLRQHFTHDSIDVDPQTASYTPPVWGGTEDPVPDAPDITWSPATLPVTKMHPPISHFGKAYSSDCEGDGHIDASISNAANVPACCYLGGGVLSTPTLLPLLFSGSGRVASQGGELDASPLLSLHPVSVLQGGDVEAVSMGQSYGGSTIAPRHTDTLLQALAPLGGHIEQWDVANGFLHTPLPPRGMPAWWRNIPADHQPDRNSPWMVLRAQGFWWWPLGAPKLIHTDDHEADHAAIKWQVGAMIGEVEEVDDGRLATRLSDLWQELSEPEYLPHSMSRSRLFDDADVLDDVFDPNIDFADARFDYMIYKWGVYRRGDIPHQIARHIVLSNIAQCGSSGPDDSLTVLSAAWGLPFAPWNKREMHDIDLLARSVEAICQKMVEGHGIRPTHMPPTRAAFALIQCIYGIEGCIMTAEEAATLIKITAAAMPGLRAYISERDEETLPLPPSTSPPAVIAASVSGANPSSSSFGKGYSSDCEGDGPGEEQPHPNAHLEANEQSKRRKLEHATDEESAAVGQTSSPPPTGSPDDDTASPAPPPQELPYTASPASTSPQEPSHQTPSPSHAETPHGHITSPTPEPPHQSGFTCNCPASLYRNLMAALPPHLRCPATPSHYGYESNLSTFRRKSIVLPSTRSHAKYLSICVNEVAKSEEVVVRHKLDLLIHFISEWSESMDQEVLDKVKMVKVETAIISRAMHERRDELDDINKQYTAASLTEDETNLLLKDSLRHVSLPNATDPSNRILHDYPTIRLLAGARSFSTNQEEADYHNTKECNLIGNVLHHGVAQVRTLAGIYGVEHATPVAEVDRSRHYSEIDPEAARLDQYGPHDPEKGTYYSASSFYDGQPYEYAHGMCPDYYLNLDASLHRHLRQFPLKFRADPPNYIDVLGRGMHVHFFGHYKLPGVIADELALTKDCSLPGCSKTGNTFLCGQCQIVHYHDVDCQQRDLGDHRHFCLENSTPYRRGDINTEDFMQHIIHRFEYLMPLSFDDDGVSFAMQNTAPKQTLLVPPHILSSDLTPGRGMVPDMLPIGFPDSR